jgi:uncharacterized protein YbbC (DUF1343 family)
MHHRASHHSVAVGQASRRWFFVAVLTTVALTAGAVKPLRPDKLAALDAAVDGAISQSTAPGAVLWLERAGEVYRKAYGRRALVPATEPMTEDTLFDAASLTKVVATTPSVMLLIEEGKVKLDETVRTYLPEFSGDGREQVTVRHLLTHTSGLRPGIPQKTPWAGYDEGIKLACAEKPEKPPGSAFRYSDVNFLLLGEIVRRVSGEPLNEFTARRVFRPLKMDDTGFLPPPARIGQIAPTEPADGQMLRGVVHDPTARRMGGVAGHAGLFTTARDLARYTRMLLNGGELDGVRVLKPETVTAMTRAQTPAGMKDKRGLGWDIDTSYSKPRGEVFPVGSYGHTGFTGTSLWIDPGSRTFVLLLSSRLHPDGKGNVSELREQIGTLAAEAAGLTRPIAQVLNGIDVLKREGFARLKGRKVGLITNHTGHDRARNPTIDLLHQAPGVQLKALFSPEHGIRGALDQAKIADTTDERTGLPVFSLYGERRAPLPEQLRDLDTLVFDIQDIGCRFYTYIATMGNCLEAAGKAKLKFFVLDRVNPINGTDIEGPVYAGEPKFIAYHRLPLRHGLTAGELARRLWFDETGLPWTNPSPNMRRLPAAILYPGVGLLEQAVSVGRGTDVPFEILGAPYVDDVAFAAELNRAGLAGVRFVPARFTPTASVFQGKECGGVSILLTDRDRLNTVDLGLALALTLQRMYPKDFALEKVQTLLQDRATLDGIKAGKSLADIKNSWAAGLADFKKRREAFLLYR